MLHSINIRISDPKCATIHKDMTTVSHLINKTIRQRMKLVVDVNFIMPSIGFVEFVSKTQNNSREREIVHSCKII